MNNKKDNRKKTKNKPNDGSLSNLNIPKGIEEPKGFSKRKPNDGSSSNISIGIEEPKGFSKRKPKPNDGSSSNISIGIEEPKGFSKRKPKPNDGSNISIGIEEPKGFSKRKPKPNDGSSSNISIGIEEPKGFSKRKPKPNDGSSSNISIGIEEPKDFSKRKPLLPSASSCLKIFQSKPLEILSNPSTSAELSNSKSPKMLSWDKNLDYNENSTKKFFEDKKSFNMNNSLKSSSQYDKMISDINNKNVNSLLLDDKEEIGAENDNDFTSDKKKQLKVVYIDDDDLHFNNEIQIQKIKTDDLPPVFPDIEKFLEDLNLAGLEDLSIHDFTKHIKFSKPNNQVDNLFDLTMAPDATTLEAKRNPITGELIEFCEVAISGQELTAKNSMSWERAPEPFDEENITGHACNKPFWPGGFSEPENIESIEEIEKIDFKDNFLVDPPGCYGINFKSDGRTLQEWDRKRIDSDFIKGNNQIEFSFGDDDEDDDEENSNSEETIINLMIFGNGNDFKFDEGLWESHIVEEEKKLEQECKVYPNNEEEETVIPEEIDIPILKISNAVIKQVIKTKWAELLDVTKPVLDFDAKVPIMAHSWPFQLDIFQKQAIIKLEEHNHVFVAAHTSAGKTVIAEYAIALSQNHKTRTIYTSPIKALSNQKYRDFRDTFQDVGLVTGDFQINTTASCLVMTTEILKSMLYRGSDVLRDLEYVIFDEVHYINDSERGHVWEETLILLPKEVCIVMLSATVPNTMEFADWVGNTKKTKVYVVSTLKRPVPLQHYLYVGPVLDKNQLFKIRDAEGEFLTEGYFKAVVSKSNRKNPGKRGGSTRLNPIAQRNLFISFLNYLKKNQNLPVVIFTLSRKRCDQNAKSLLSMDFTTSTEKSKIHRFFNDSIKNLQNEDDRNLPQVKSLELLLKNGIGIHHSGILPILKEIVEMLFQKGLVKILFATETFAMGVNMPARTVAFDSIRKFDGNEPRNLNPAEYIQMAGRAGRRGLDENGTVIIMCKEDLPSQEELKAMMLGKQTKLESQFRLTYSMILNLMRVSMVNVEEMMSMSFKEFGMRFKNQKNQEALALLEAEIRQKNEVIEEGDEIYENFIDEAINYFEIKNEYLTMVEKTPEYKNAIVPGVVLHIWTKKLRDKLAIVCKIDVQKSFYRVLVFTDGKETLSNTNNSKEEIRPTLYYKMLSMLVSDLYRMETLTTDHAVINIEVKHITSIISARPVKVDFDKIISNWDLRQQFRFRSTPISEPTQYALNYLYEIYIDIFQTPQSQKLFKALNVYEFVKTTNLSLSDTVVELRKQHNVIQKLVTIIQENNSVIDPEMFYRIYKRKENDLKLSELRHLLSTQSMSLYGDYNAKVQVLEELNYINSQRIVQLKGNVACEMGNEYELLITELLFQNKLVNFSPEEIAALLSCLVFKAKSTLVAPNPTEMLKQGIKIIQELFGSIEKVEKKHGVQKEGNLESDKLNFNLVHVVYEWAMQKPFKDIMTLTDVQEGIIVKCIQQLCELLRSIKDGAKIFGERDLPLKMDQAIQVIKRDIVFAPSLYTT